VAALVDRVACEVLSSRHPHVRDARFKDTLGKLQPDTLEARWVALEGDVDVLKVSTQG
jgi:hypothetical protein